MTLRFATAAALRLQGRIKLSRLLEMPECDFEKRVRQLEADGLFRHLTELGVLQVQPYPQARFFARSFEGRELRAAHEDLPELLDGRGDLAKLIARVGRQRFEACFLRDDVLPDEERARRCGISVGDARRLREFVDRLYIRAEFESHESRPVPSTAYSAVAGIAVEGGRPVIGFFNREIWKGRYEIDQPRRAALRATLPADEFRRLDRFLLKAELLNRRKTTLYQALELLVEEQAEYLATGDPDRRRALTQRRIAARLGAAPSVLNRVIANKSIETPWGLEIPLKALLPSRKAILRDRLYDVAMEQPQSTDALLRDELFRRWGTKVSPRSVTQYRKDLGLGGCGRRGDAPLAIKRMVAVCALLAVSLGLGVDGARAASFAPAASGGAFHAAPVPGWAGVVQNIYPTVQSRALLNPGLLSLSGVLGNISLRLPQDGPTGLRSMEFVRFMPKRYQDRPEAFARLPEERRVASMARAVRAASRALDSEVSELVAKAAAGEAGATEIDRLVGIYGNRFYLSSEARGRVESAVDNLASGAPASDPIHTAVAKLKALAETPLRGDAIFDNRGRESAVEAGDTPAVPVPAFYASQLRPNGLARAISRSSRQRESEMQKTRTDSRSFRNIAIEGKTYPTVIMGEDNFTGWFGKGDYPSEAARAAAYGEALSAAYAQGVRGFSMSPHPTLLAELRRFKKDHSDIIVIANPHWQSHYYIGDESLWTPRNRGRVLATVAAMLPEAVRAASALLQGKELPPRFSKEEIERFRLDEEEFKAQLGRYKGLADFSIVGNLSFGVLAYTGRQDIIEREIALVRAAGMIPLGISEGGDSSAAKLKGLDVAGLWMWANRTERFPAPGNVAGATRGAAVPVTAFRVFEHPDKFDVEASLEFLRKAGKVVSIVVGVDDKAQATETFSKIRAVFGTGGGTER